MVNINNAGNDDTAKRIIVVNNVLSECQDRNNNKFHKVISIRFVLSVEFTCPSCSNRVIAKVETPEEKVICSECHNCKFTLTDTFNKILKSAKRPTPHRIQSRRLSSERTNKAGRPPLDKVRREPTQLTLHPDTIDALYKLDVSRGELFEFLLHLFPPFTSILKNGRQE